jgi:hypothetical protein
VAGRLGSADDADENAAYEIDQICGGFTALVGVLVGTVAALAGVSLFASIGAMTALAL